MGARYLLLPSLLLVRVLSAQTSNSLSASDVISRWRAAVHADTVSRSVVVTTVSTEDGIPGRIPEWATNDSYREEIQRDFDQSDLVISKNVRERRDWNGWIRKLEGPELERTLTGITAERVVLFGPPADLSASELSQSPDHQTYILKYKPQGAWMTTWYIDAKTFLPAKSVRPGDDSEITTTYSDWRTVDGFQTPFHAVVMETDKPDYSWDRKSLDYKSSLSEKDFSPLTPVPSDATLSPNAPPIPFTMEANHIVFSVSVNGRSPMPFILDTGADQNVINSTSLDAYGIKPYAMTTTTGGGNSADYGYAADVTLNLPGVELRKQHVATLDQSGLETALGVKFGGILGYDFISRFVMDIDYQKQRIRLYDPKTWQYSGKGSTVPVIFDIGIPHASGSISVPTKPNIPAFFVVDFGAAETATLTSPFVNANDLVRLAQTNATVNRPAGLEKQFFAQNNVRGHLDQLTIGNLTVEQVPINMSVNTKGAYASTQFSGTVGESIYSRYHAYLDYPHNRIILEPTSESDKPFPERETYGLSILASGEDLHTFTVSAVRPGSPAEKDGFKKSDVISALDGKKASQFTLRELRDSLSHAGQHHAVEILRNGNPISLEIEVRLISIEHS